MHVHSGAITQCMDGCVVPSHNAWMGVHSGAITQCMYMYMVYCAGKKKKRDIVLLRPIICICNDQ